MVAVAARLPPTDEVSRSSTVALTTVALPVAPLVCTSTEPVTANWSTKMSSLAAEVVKLAVPATVSRLLSVRLPEVAVADRLPDTVEAPKSRPLASVMDTSSALVMMTVPKSLALARVRLLAAPSVNVAVPVAVIAAACVMLSAVTLRSFAPMLTAVANDTASEPAPPVIARFASNPLSPKVFTVRVLPELPRLTVSELVGIANVVFSNVEPVISSDPAAALSCNTVSLLSTPTGRFRIESTAVPSLSIGSSPV